ncbi:hypothetical protein V1521DRAFT_462059 [Lipomyces starkeyi]
MAKVIIDFLIGLAIFNDINPGESQELSQLGLSGPLENRSVNYRTRIQFNEGYPLLNT